MWSYQLGHLSLMTTDVGMLEHSSLAHPLVHHGCCTDDNARLLVVMTREPDEGTAHRLGRVALQIRPLNVNGILSELLAAMRFHPGVPWDTKDVVDLRSGGADTPQAQRANRRQSLLVFADMDGENRLDIESETADLRVYFRFRPNAWVPQDLPASAASGDLVFANAWKRSPRLQEVTLEYLNRTVTRGGRSVFAR